MNKGSSETTRETLLEKKSVFYNSIERFNQTTLFNFDAYIQNGMPRHKRLDKPFLEWFIGFFEAEGCFLKWHINGKSRFGIEITQKDPKLMYKIRTRLGFGRVVQIENQSPNRVYWRYYVHDFNKLTGLIWLFNGHLITDKKTTQFSNWLMEINKQKKQHYAVINTKPTVSFNTAWLCGFLEGDGGFWVSSNSVIYKTKHNSLSYSIRMTFSITQTDEYQLLNQIKILFKIPTKIYQITNSHSSEQYNRLETDLLICHQQIMDYLQTYPFLGQRNILVQRWSRLIGYRTKNYPITEKSIKKLKQLIKSTKNNFLT
jgi:LAGLIDADG endonuclease